MNEKIEAKKKLLKQALSKNQPKVQEVTNQRMAGRILQTKKYEEKTIQKIQIPFLGEKRKNQGFQWKEKPMRIQENLSSIVSEENSIYTQSDNFSQKPSYRSSLSESLYTEETEKIKMLIEKLFERKNFLEKVQQELKEELRGTKSRNEIIEIKGVILRNETFILSLQIRVREKKGKQREQLIEREVRKKIVGQMVVEQNQKECYNSEMRIESFLQQKLRQIRRKEY